MAVRRTFTVKIEKDGALPYDYVVLEELEQFLEEHGWAGEISMSTGEEHVRVVR